MFEPRVALTIAPAIILGALLIVAPRISRRGLLFGVYVGEAAARGEAASRITRAWTLRMLLALGLTCAAGITIAMLDRTVWAVPITTFLLLIGFYWAYVDAHRQSRALAAPAPSVSVGALAPPSPVKLVLPFAALAVVFGLAASAAVYGAMQYESLPDKIPLHFALNGEADRWVAKSPEAVFLLPALNLLVSGMLCGVAFLIANAKRSLRHERKGISLDAQIRFHQALTLIICVLAILLSVLLAAATFSMIQVGLGHASRLSLATMIGGGSIGVLAVGMIALVALRYGQGGSKLERDVEDAPLTGGLADNRHWYLGLIYFNREDPSLLIERRFGIGYTVNFGNWKAVAILVGLLVLALGVPIVSRTAL
ncbi:MAG TPA: DUF1648 domain-containing protein, partial [Gammaproteobacteria bacterium]